MLKVKDIALAERYGDGFECTVTFQVGDQSYNTVKAKLPAEATRAVVELAIAKATAMLIVVGGEVPIAGEPKTVPLIEEAADPMFAEVDEALPQKAPAEMEAF